jgi:hypothetical protein
VHCYATTLTISDSLAIFVEESKSDFFSYFLFLFSRHVVIKEFFFKNDDESFKAKSKIW